MSFSQTGHQTKLANSVRVTINPYLGEKRNSIRFFPMILLRKPTQYLRLEFERNTLYLLSASSPLLCPLFVCVCLCVCIVRIVWRFWMIHFNYNFTFWTFIQFFCRITLTLKNQSSVLQNRFKQHYFSFFIYPAEITIKGKSLFASGSTSSFRKQDLRPANRALK